MLGTKKAPCEDCGVYDRLIRVEEERWVCHDCYHDYKRCIACEERYHEDDMTRNAEGDWVCENCKRDIYRRCIFCEEWYHEEEVSEIWPYDGPICEECRREQGIRKPYVPEYDEWYTC